MHKNRPVNLALTKFKFPPMAIVSICHRITGVLIFLFLPIMLCLLSHSLLNNGGFNETVEWMQHPLMKLFMWIVIAVTLFHVVAGTRHLIMDLGFGESLTAGRNSAYAVFIIAAVLIILAGWWIW